jgi:PAS domain S-box-containing protein
MRHLLSKRGLVKNVKVQIQEVKEAKTLLLDSDESSDLFWKLFNHYQSAIGITNEEGEVILSNELFAASIIQVPSPPDFTSIIEDIKNQETKIVEGRDFNFDNGQQIIKLTLLKITRKKEGAHYFWLASLDAEVSIHHKMSIFKNLYRSFIDNTFELIFRTSIDGKILFANNLFLQSFGFETYQNIKNISVQTIFEATEQYQTIVMQLKAEQRIDKETIFFRKKDGTRLTGIVNCNLYQDESNTPVLNWTISDITNQIESENTLKSSNEQLAKVNQQMEKFLYSTSHDLRSPITSILGLVNLMRMESKEAIVLDYISKIESSTQKLDKVIRDIMSFSRATYTRLASDKINFEILAWKAFNNYRNNPSSRKIHFEVKSNGIFPFYADSERLDIIFDNIIRNAIHFHDANKSRPFIQVNISINKSSALLEFIDNGIGIGKQHLDHIFTMFYRASHVSKGAGLGLYIVKETLEKLGGKVSIESEIGFGTVLRITIPNGHKGKLIDRKLQLVNHADSAS